MDGYTEEELALLTDEERAALSEPDEVEEEEEVLEEKPQPEPEKQPKPEPEKAEPEKAAPAAEEKPQPEPEKQEPEKQEPEKAITAPRPRGVLNEQLPEDYQQRVEANNTAQDDLAQKYEDGDISFAEFNKGMRKLNTEAMDLREIKMRAEISDQSASNSLQQHWDDVMGSFLNEHPEAISTSVRQNAFDQILREVTAPVMAAGGMPGRTEIDKAWATFSKEFGLEAKKPEPEKQEKQPNKVPPVLGGLPAASTTGTEDGRWAQLDRLIDTDPLRYEDELAKLSDADRNAYLQSA